MALKLLFERDNMYIYPWYISDLTITKDIGKISKITVKKAVICFKKDRLHMYYDRQSANAVGEVFLKKLLSSKKFFYEAIENIYHYSNELMRFCKKIKDIPDTGKLSDKQLLQIYLEYMRRLRILRVWGWIPSSMDGMEKAYLSDYLMGEFRKYLRRIEKEKKFNDYYATLSSSEKKSEVQEEELARLNLLMKIQRDKKARQIFVDIRKGNVVNFEIKYRKTSQFIQQHLRDFGWLTYAYAGPAMTIDYLFKSLAENIKTGNISTQKKKITNHYKNIKKEKQRIIKKIKLPENLKYAFQVSAEMMFIKDYRKGIYQKSYVAMDKIIEEIAKRLELTAKEVKYLVLEEIRDALQNKRIKRYKKISKERTKLCCYIATNGKIKVYEGKKAREIINKLKKESDRELEKEKTAELKGMMAYKGKVWGTAKIVLIVKDVPKVKPGDILVSSATNPDLIMAMKRAAAIVTDTGGIISHAAIVSRELKKPCVVGTKIATKILKDGDLVEVDANNGIIKILKE
jgi:phosphoenolpyruvate synthase/pyruvate phosphate dikinase